MNKQIFVAVLFSAQLGGCAVTTRHSEPFTGDYNACAESAKQQHPVKLHQYVSHGYVSSGGISIATAPEVQEIDLNRDRRNIARDACMSAKGWRFTPIIGWSNINAQ